MLTYSNLFLTIHKIGIVLCVASIAGVIVLYTPLPASSYPDCNRPCHELDWPMICRFKFYVEYFEIFNVCYNQTCSDDDHCVSEICDEFQNIYMINKKLLGPTMQVCKNDILVIDIINKIPGHSLSFHWHGQPVRETPSMDGVPMVTQCPIQSHTIYQYKLRAAQSGTYYYHALTGDKFLDRSLQGGIIVRESNRQEIHKHLYDEDIMNHTLHLTQHNNLIYLNGKHIISEFHVTENTRYRFRVIQGALCPIKINIDGHQLLIIAIDGYPIDPKMVKSIELAPGERLDFILLTNNKLNQYNIIISPIKLFNQIKISKHVLIYNTKLNNLVEEINKDIKNHDSIEKTIEQIQTEKINDKISKEHIEKLNIKSNDLVENLASNELSNQIDKFNENQSKNSEISIEKVEKANSFSTIRSVRNSNLLILEDLKPMIQNEKILKKTPDVSLTLEYYTHDFNNISFLFPSSPLVSQMDLIDSNKFCSNKILNSFQSDSVCTTISLCNCIHRISVGLTSVVEVTLVDKGNFGDHIFHLHGFGFYIIQRGNQIKQNKNEDFKNINLTPLKDTIYIPKGEWATILFQANNAGFWSLHNQFNLQQNIIFQVGEIADLPPTPQNYPTCGNYIGPEFFLI